VAQEKERIIKQSEVLEYYPTDARMTDVGGLDQLKEWLDRRGRAFGAGARDFGLDAPKGVLLLGVQGCGKSLLAKAIAATWQFPLLRFDMGKVFGGIVGQSEGNIRTALQVAQALAPCVLWIDEIEKGLAGMGSSDQTDGGTTARVVGTLLTWMQEKRDPVFVVATANRIDMLPPELLRKGRFDEIFFVDLPTRAIREEILSIHLKKKRPRPEGLRLKPTSPRGPSASRGRSSRRPCARACSTPSPKAASCTPTTSRARWTRPSRSPGRCATRSMACASGRRCARGSLPATPRAAAAGERRERAVPRLRQEPPATRSFRVPS
jgi:hypothetical protein